MCAAPSRSSSMSASAWRSRSAATSPKAACSRCCASATAGTSPSTRASSATPRARSASSTSTRASSRSSARTPPRRSARISTRGERFVLVTAPDARPYVRMIIERLFPTLPVLSPCRDRQGRRDPRPRNHLVTVTAEGAVIAAFLAFCRIGGCFMVMPGLSSARVPMQVRLFVAVAATLAAARSSCGTRSIPSPTAGPAVLVPLHRVGTADRRR